MPAVYLLPHNNGMTVSRQVILFVLQETAFPFLAHVGLIVHAGRDIQVLGQQDMAKGTLHSIPCTTPSLHIHRLYTTKSIYILYSTNVLCPLYSACFWHCRMQWCYTAQPVVGALFLEQANESKEKKPTNSLSAQGSHSWVSHCLTVIGVKQ